MTGVSGFFSIGNDITATPAVMFLWQDAKTFLEHTITVSSDAVHVILGVACMFAVAIVARRPLSHWAPWTAVLLLLLCNEAADLWIERWPVRAMQYGESAKDVMLTMLLPTLLLLVARFAPDVYARQTREAANRVEAGGR